MLSKTNFYKYNILILMDIRNDALIKSEKIVYNGSSSNNTKANVISTARTNVILQRDMNNKQFSNAIMLLHKSQRYKSNITENRKKIFRK